MPNQYSSTVSAATQFPPFLLINIKWSNDERSITSRGAHGSKAPYYTTPNGPNNSPTQTERKDIHFQLAVLFITTGLLAQFIKDKDNKSMTDTPKYDIATDQLFH